MNRSQDKRQRGPNPVSNASFLSKSTFWWLKPIFTIGLRRSIEDDDIYDVTNSLRSENNTDTFAKLWELESTTKHPSIWRMMWNVYGLKVTIITILYLVAETTAAVFQPICLGGLVSYFAQTESKSYTRLDAFYYAFGIVISRCIIAIVYHPFMLYINEESCKIRVACGGLIYRKALRITKSSANDGQTGQIINLLSTDLWKFGDSLTFIFELIRGPVQTITFFVLIYMEIGIAAFFGMAFLLSFIPVQLWLGRKSGELRLKNTKRTDFRIKIMNEILMGIQVIKMYAWEKSFAEMVDEIRKKEVNVIRSIAYVRATIKSLTMISKVSIFLSLIAYVYFDNVITARKVFIISSYFNILNTNMVYLWPLALTFVAEAVVSINRVRDFLLCPESKSFNMQPHLNGFQFELEKKTKPNLYKHCSKNLPEEENLMTTLLTEKPSKRIQNINESVKCLKFDNVTAVWKRTENQLNGLFDINIEIKPGLCAVIGQVGSGKSTLLNVILGELAPDAGLLKINGSISYASQEPWIFEGSVQDNIVFVEDFDKQRYNKVVEVCALERDFKLLPQGDATIVGEQGSSLSGGQKARVNLARAIYKRSDIYLLDDPLSAVDTHVGKHIFEKCIKGFLRDKICILVTHQLQYLKNVQHVVLMSEGRVEAQGPFQTLERFNKEALMHAQDDGDQNALDNEQTQIRKQSSCVSFCNEEDEDNSDARKERQESGSIKFDTYKTYFKAAHNRVYVFFGLSMFVLAQLACTGSDYIMSEWVNWEENNQKMPPNDKPIVELSNNSTIATINSNSNEWEERKTLIIIYTSIIAMGTFFYFIRSFSFFHICLRISINLHDMIFRSISRAKMFFFNNNPSGRILNRFAKDINNVDSLLPTIIVDVIDHSLQYISIIVINANVNPWLLVPAGVLTVFFILMRMIYIKTGRSFKRFEASSRSPLFSHVNATLQGLDSVRAFDASSILEKEFHDFQNHNTSCWYLFIAASRWFAFWLDIVSVLFIASVTFSFLLLKDKMRSGEVGLAILSSFNLIGMCQWGIRQSTEMENQMISVERIVEYAELPPEPSLESDEEDAPRKDWPQYGNIEFKSLSLRYAENASRILRNLTFKINAKEKVGVVGRTGAGKSSIIQSLFRLAQNEGQILIDGVDVGVIGLHDLRKKISIIPQEAVLFSGSLRFNLDPFAERTDDELWHSLEQVELKSVVSTLPGGLDSKVLDGGSNFSAGQRQLLCLARAILRNNKILILDEATANVDSETDKLIQETIRRKFADCTVITIAHRLHTVMDSDKVLVVDAGEIVEFDHPYNLIKKSDGVFKKLLDQTGTTTAAELTIIAEECFERCHKDVHENVV